MVISIRSIETAVPPRSLPQHRVRDLFAAQPGLQRRSARLVRACFDHSGIDVRHTVLDELGTAVADDGGVPDVPGARGDGVFYDRGSGTLLSPPTGTRNDLYVARAPELFVAAARAALDAAEGLTAEDVTHVVTVSCTGFFAPGPEYRVVRELGLRTSTQRYHLGFMGCYAAFPALRMARDLCAADPGAVVLVVCAELCSLHLASSDDPDTIVASSVFADGAAAAVVSARTVGGAGPVLDLDAFTTTLTDVGEQDMAWSIGDHGFEMVLSRYVPHIIGENIRGALAPLLGSDLWPTDVARWAVHPGGRAILDKVQAALGLADVQLVPSRETLRAYGNMSSPTVLFVLRRILHGLGAGPEDDTTMPASGDRVCAMAFGPGLAVESALMTWRAEAG